MGRKIFVSYKYGDDNVYPLGSPLFEVLYPTTVRDYVDEMQKLLSEDDHINKGEADGEDLSDFADSTIESKLRDKIYDSSITIVVISPNMRELYTPESDQWIPWEISYSLKEHSRNGRTSQSNAMLAIVLPDRSNCYNYYIDTRCFCNAGCQIYNTDKVFQIMARNMFNVKTPSYMACSSGKSIFQGHASYIHNVTWHDFKLNPDLHLNIATEINENIYNYNLVKTVS